VSWQVVPTVLGPLMSDPDPKKARATVDAMMKMKKLVIADLKKAHDEA
jgi:predicted 3-demethylubiquinone-9 3-methyltransferase (glyoxalase superfamily)